MLTQIENSKSPRWLKFLLLTAILLAVLTVVISSYIRLAESGLGCSDWPDCYGFYQYNESAQGVNVLTEKGEDSPHRLARINHRLVTSVLGIIVLLVFMLSFRSGFSAVLGRKIPFGLLILTLMLALIGRIHPTQPLPILTLANFVGGLLLVTFMSILYFRVTNDSVEKIPGPVFWLVRAGLLIVALQIILGGWTSANLAGASCEELFQCDVKEISLDSTFRALTSSESLALDQNDRVVDDEKMNVIQWIHHLGAVMVLVYFISLIFLLIRLSHRLHLACFGLLALLFAEFLLGMIALSTQLPLLVVVSHNLLAALLLMSTTYLNIKVSKRVSL